MDMLGRTRIGLWMALLAGAAGWGEGRVLAQAAPANPVPAATATKPASAPARKPTVDELLATRKPAAFDFTDRPISEIIDYIARSYNLEIVNKYELTDRLTMKELGNLKAREAINILNGAILAMGYTVVESVRGDPPNVVLTIIPTKVDAGTLVTVYYGSDPERIPEGEDRRTQVMSFVAVDPEKARDMILAVVGAQADITVNVSTRTIIITDTATHVHTAAAVLQLLEKQATEKK